MKITRISKVSVIVNFLTGLSVTKLCNEYESLQKIIVKYLLR